VVNAHAPVLEGIKEGVQGVGRLIAAGLESIAGGPVDISFSSPGAESLPFQPLVLNPASKPGNKALKLGHGQNESQSSSSTSASGFSTFSSSSTNTSVTSIASSCPLEEGKNVSPTMESTPLSVGEAEYHDEDTSIESTTSDISEQVLFVRDTGATPTMSPNPEFEQKRRARQRNEKRKGKLSGSPVRKSKVQRGGIALIEDSWHNSDAVPSTSYGAEEPHLTNEISELKDAAPTSSSNPSDGVTPQHLNSWMGSVGKKWGEIKGSSAST